MSRLSLLRDRNSSKTSEERKQSFLVFQLGQEQFALPLLAVQKVSLLGSIFGDPLSSGIGLTVHEGQQLAVIDVERRILQKCAPSLAETPHPSPDVSSLSSAGQYLLILQNSQGEMMGLPVDSKPKIQAFLEQKLQPLPATYKHHASIHCVSAMMIQNQDQPIFVLNPDLVCKSLNSGETEPSFLQSELLEAPAPQATIDPGMTIPTEDPYSSLADPLLADPLLADPLLADSLLADSLLADPFAGESIDWEAFPMDNFEIPVPGVALSAPDVFAPDAPAPDALTPDSPTPDALTPEDFAPDIFAPDIFAPDIFAPDVLAPDILAPDVPAPAVPDDVLAAGADIDWENMPIIDFTAEESFLSPVAEPPETDLANQVTLDWESMSLEAFPMLD